MKAEKISDWKFAGRKLDQQAATCPGIKLSESLPKLEVLQTAHYPRPPHLDPLKKLEASTITHVSNLQDVVQQKSHLRQIIICENIEFSSKDERYIG